jgi:hypothetical protein
VNVLAPRRTCEKQALQGIAAACKLVFKSISAENSRSTKYLRRHVVAKDVCSAWRDGGAANLTAKGGESQNGVGLWKHRIDT